MSAWHTEKFIWSEADLRRLAEEFGSIEVKLTGRDGNTSTFFRQLRTGKLEPLAFGQGLDVLLLRGVDLRSEEARHLYWARIACDAAMLSLCRVARCGAAIVGRSEFIADPLFAGSLLSVGFNQPPGGIAHRRCHQTSPSKRHPKADRTCCVHAEVKAILNVDRSRLQDSTLYFVRVDAEGNLQPSGRPYCTGCSKLALEVGIGKWVLWHADGPREYAAEEYNDLSHNYDALEELSEEERFGLRASGSGKEGGAGG